MLCYLNAEHHPQRVQFQFSEEEGGKKEKVFLVIRIFECYSRLKVHPHEKTHDRIDKINTPK